MSKLTPKKRKEVLFDWPNTAFGDIKNICETLCTCKQLPKKTINKLKPHKNIICKISKAKNPAVVQQILS